MEQNKKLLISQLRIAITDKEHPLTSLDKCIQGFTNTSYTIVKRSLDARKKNHPCYIYTVSFPYSDELFNALQKKTSGVFNISISSNEQLSPDISIKASDKNGYDNTIKNPYKNPDTITKNTHEKKNKIVIAGMGPAGIFCALSLLEHGVVPDIIEMGKPVEERIKDIHGFFQSGVFNPFSNVNYGEGGAGTYSDGKLTTRTKNPDIIAIFKYFVRFGADESILYDNAPHLGTDMLKIILQNCRKYLLSKAVSISFNTELTDIIPQSNRTTSNTPAQFFPAASSQNPSYVCVLRNTVDAKVMEKTYHTIILCTGHSNTAVYSLLFNRHIGMLPKTFAAGFRVEHPAELVNQNQYGKNAPRKYLPTASYTLTHKASPKVSVYSFCMCPGGIVLPSASEVNGIVTNGASNSERSSTYSNAAIVATIPAEAFSDMHAFLTNRIYMLLKAGLLDKEHMKNIHDAALLYLHHNQNKAVAAQSTAASKQYVKTFEGIIIQRLLETVVKRPQHLRAPAQQLKNMVLDKKNIGSGKKPTNPWDEARSYKSTYAHGTYDCDLLAFFPEDYRDFFISALLNFDDKIKGFIAEGVAIGYETRTSSAVKIMRSDNLELFDMDNKAVKNLYFAGEGSGWAGGITTSALDGYLTAKKVLRKL